MAKKTYVRPTIVRNLSGLAKKHGTASTVRARTRIDGVPVADLIAEHGSPLFVFSESAIRKAAREARRAFASRYPRVRFAWSYKTNYLDAVCRIFHQEGALAEVVSE